MAKFTIQDEKYKDALWVSILHTVDFLTKKIIEITPRDPKRPPKDPSQKITWNLKKSIENQEVEDLSYVIWSKQTEAEYWPAQEYWTIYIPARSFLRKWLIDNAKKSLKVFETSMKTFL